jgi:hypoxanthine phosphoribosyltransferase
MRTNYLPRSIRPRRAKAVANLEIRRGIGSRVDWAEARRRWPRASVGTGSVVAGPEPVAIDPKTWITTVRLVEDTARLCSQLPGDLDAVLGIARSGLVPATQVAVMLHRRLFSVRTFETDPAQILDCGGGWRLLGTGDRGQGTGDRGQGTGNRGEGLKKVVIVDDTAWHGIAIQHVKRLAGQRWPGAQLFTAVVYAHPQTLSLVDYAACSYGGPHYLEWNLFNASHVDPAVGGGLVTDLDGILCPDIPPENDDDGLRYLAAIRSALPIQRPNRRPVSVIVTARLEKYRAETESWLRRSGIRWQRLTMGPWPTLRQRTEGWPENVVRLKSESYLSSGCGLMVESDPQLARAIARRTRKPVLCPALGGIV